MRHVVTGNILFGVVLTVLGFEKHSGKISEELMENSQESMDFG